QESEKFRKSLLEAARDVVILLKNNSKFLEIKERKKELLLDIQKDMSELKILTEKLNDLILDNELKKEIALNTDIEPETKPIKLKSKDSLEVTEIDRLEYTLNKIEERLNSLKH